jgi:hypothetical protein
MLIPSNNKEVVMLHPLRLGVAAGIVWSLSMFVCTILAVYTGYSEQFLQLMASIYPGYTISLAGSIVGLIYGFFDAFVGFFLVAWLYNRLQF